MNAVPCGDSAKAAGTLGVATAYNAVAAAYCAAFENELDRKPLDRALLTAFTELVERGAICDVGCGPGHVTQFLARRYSGVMGLDISSVMIEIARKKVPDLVFEVGSMLALPVAEGGWAGIVALYSIIHLTTTDRASAWQEFARAVRPGGWLLVAFHVDSEEFAAGAVNQMTSWFGENIELDGYFLDPDMVAAEITAAGFTVQARLQRQAIVGAEYPSRRCYFLAQR